MISKTFRIARMILLASFALSSAAWRLVQPSFYISLEELLGSPRSHFSAITKQCPATVSANV